MNIADTAIGVVDKVGIAARFISKYGKPALPVIEFVAGFVPGAAPVVKILELAGPVLDKIAASAPIAEQMIKQGKPALDALQAASPDLLHSFKQLYAIAVNHDPDISISNMTADQVSDHAALHFAGPVLLGRKWTDEETQRWWDRAQGTA